MTVPTLRVVAWGAALLGISVVIALVRMQPRVTPNEPATVETANAGSETDPPIKPSDDERHKDPLIAVEQTEPEATGASSTAPNSLPQNVEDLRATYPLLVARIEPNEQRLGTEGKDPLWSGSMETRIVDEISRKALGLEITDLQVDCRTTLCRVDMTFPLQFATKTFEPFTPDTAWNGKQPLMFFVKALDLDFHEQVAAGLNRYGTPVLVGYVFRPPDKTDE